MPQRRRKTEAAAAAVLLALAAPLSLLIGVGIWLADGGPIFYVADRAGLRGAIFRMYKFRTMRVESKPGSRVVGPRDSRVFPFGAWMRRLKLDEIPQLLNIVRGEMAFVGPRPETPWFVDHAYSEADRQTLDVLPGLTSPGTLYYVTHAHQFLEGDDTEKSYISGPLKVKLALDCVYIRRMSPARDLQLAIETVWVLARIAMGRRHFPEYRPEVLAADRRWSGD